MSPCCLTSPVIWQFYLEAIPDVYSVSYTTIPAFNRILKTFSDIQRFQASFFDIRKLHLLPWLIITHSHEAYAFLGHAARYFLVYELLFSVTLSHFKTEGNLADVDWLSLLGNIIII